MAVLVEQKQELSLQACIVGLADPGKWMVATSGDAIMGGVGLIV
jgi:hypothetical protein